MAAAAISVAVASGCIALALPLSAAIRSTKKVAPTKKMLSDNLKSEIILDSGLLIVW